MDDTAWGQVDLLWTIIFLFIIAFIMYWAFDIFTDRRNRKNGNTPSNTFTTNTNKNNAENNDEEDEYEYYEVDILDPDNLIQL